MPRQRPATTGYARLAQADEEERQNAYYDDYDEDEDPFARQEPLSLSHSTPHYAPINAGMSTSNQSSPDHRRRPGTGRRRHRSNSSGVDIKAINARLERWAEEIASKFKRSKKGKTQEEEEHLEIHHSVFQAPEGIRPITAEALATGNLEDRPRMTKVEFEEVVESVRIAIENGMHPKMITQGSSGSYFARNSSGKVVGVFKPKDEEPYAVGNPKWTKWIHRNLFPCCFGRECLIPNLSYVSEAAAYVLDCQLRTNIVPYTDVVWLSSKSFFYGVLSHRTYWRKNKQLPPKVGSFQVFLKGYKDATLFLREHPWPDQGTTGLNGEANSKKRKRLILDACRAIGTQSDDEDEGPRVASPEYDEADSNVFRWTDKMKQNFREELEKLVILDYIMRNTDRGLDNWMIKFDNSTGDVSILSHPPKMNGGAHDPDSDGMAHPVPVNLQKYGTSDLPSYRRQEAMMATSRSQTPSNVSTMRATMSVGAIDNSLSWPWKHPDAWRSYPFGWLFLPVSMIGQPFSQKTRDHFLPLLTSKHWWSETQGALRRIFQQDADFKESMFARQMAVMKGQAWNVVETLKQADHGPLELTRRTRVCVWDDIVDIPVAIPLHKPSAEMQRRRVLNAQEEMDIGAALSPGPNSQHDLLSLSSPMSELPNPNRFELSRDQGAADLGRVHEHSRSPPAMERDSRAGDVAEDGFPERSSIPQRPGAGRSKTRFSLEVPRKAEARQRRYSYTPRRGSNPPFYDGDDVDEGDLGYAAAAGMEGNRRKVIVERLETVKSRRPFFDCW